MENLNFGRTIRARRGELRLTLRDLSEKVHMDPANLSRIERGQFPPPRDTTILNRLADALRYPRASDARMKFLDQAQLESGRLPADLMQNAELRREVLERLPVLFRRLRIQAPASDTQIDALENLMMEA
jgi:transcriptional regulator with XRE-family HTH domain